MDAVFHALAHAHRRRILDVLAARPGVAVGELARQFDVSRIAVMNHLAVLERAGLVLSRKEARSRRLYFNAAPIQQIQDRWLSQHSARGAARLLDIKYAAEAEALAKGEDR
jgi:DNA-binding transcriptional ArsR family regulator